jgi:hypothetical protein
MSFCVAPGLLLGAKNRWLPIYLSRLRLFLLFFLEDETAMIVASTMVPVELRCHKNQVHSMIDKPAG